MCAARVQLQYIWQTTASTAGDFDTIWSMAFMLCCNKITSVISKPPHTCVKMVAFVYSVEIHYEVFGLYGRGLLIVIIYFGLIVIASLEILVADRAP